MLSKKSAVPFRGTKEQEEELLKVIEELKDEKGALMPIMQRAPGHLWISADRGPEDYLRPDGNPVREDLWSGNILCTV